MAEISGTRNDSPPGSTADFLLTAGRIGWILLTLGLIVLFVMGIAPRYAQLTTLCAGNNCPYYALQQIEADMLANLGISLGVYGVYHILVEVILAGTLTVLATIIFLRGPRTGLGLLLAVTLSIFGLSFMSETDTAIFVARSALPVWFAWLTSLGAIMFVFLLYMFPDGRFMPNWAMLPTGILVIAALLDPLIGTGGRMTTVDEYSVIVNVLLIVNLIGGFVAQIVRYRQVSSPRQRQQTKWIVLGLLVLISCMIFYAFFFEMFPLEPGLTRLALFTVVYAGLLVLLLVFPFAVVISILQYRLWDVDLVINRALVYMLLTALLAVLYFGSVIVLQRLAIQLTGSDSRLAVVFSTLLIAALFSPLRRRVQGAIDRRFFRHKYDAQLALAGFAHTARNETDPAALTAALTVVVQETLQPTQVGVWLRNEGGG